MISHVTPLLMLEMVLQARFGLEIDPARRAFPRTRLVAPVEMRQEVVDLGLEPFQGAVAVEVDLVLGSYWRNGIGAGRTCGGGSSGGVSHL